jgi:hypothetical protein
MVNKKGIVHIIEASIAILVIFSVVIFLLIKTSENKKESYDREIVQILEEIAKNSTLRQKILSYTDGKIPELDEFIVARLNPSLKYDYTICAVNDACGIVEYPVDKENDNLPYEVFANSRIISAVVSEDAGINPKRIKLFVWRE